MVVQIQDPRSVKFYDKMHDLHDCWAKFADLLWTNSPPSITSKSKLTTFLYIACSGMWCSILTESVNKWYKHIKKMVWKKRVIIWLTDWLTTWQKLIRGLKHVTGFYALKNSRLISIFLVPCIFGQHNSIQKGHLRYKTNLSW